ncbi:MAG: TolC family protein [Bacteroidetes bacterium]|nr:TolC family protein [Bacteroidota bacterium]
MKKGLLLIFTISVLSVCYGQIPQDNHSSEIKKWGIRECVEYALENSLTVKRSLYGLETSEINNRQAKWTMAPSLNFGGSYNNSWGRTIDPTTNLFTTERFQTSGVNGTSSWLLFQTSRLRNTYKQAKIDLEASKYDLEASKDLVILNVITFYTNVVFNKEQYNNTLSQLNSTQQLVERTKIQLDAGAVPQAQLYDLMAQQATNEVSVINAENNYNLSLLQLKQALQIPSFEPFDVEIPEIELTEFPMVSLSGDEIFKIALGIMPDIKSANLGIESANLGIKIAQAQLYPAIRLNASLNTNYSSVRDTDRRVATGETQTIPPIPFGTVNLDPNLVIFTYPFDNSPVFQTFEDYPLAEQFKDNIGRSISLSISIPVFNGFAVSSSVQRAIILQKQAEILLEERSNNLRQNIERSYNDVLAAKKSYDASVRQVDAQEESFRVTERSYELGASNFIDFQVAQNNLFQAKTNLLIAKYDFIFKTEILKFYQGELDY